MSATIPSRISRSWMFWLGLVLSVSGGLGLPAQQSAEAAEPEWIWNSAEAKVRVPPGKLFFRWVTELPPIETAQVEITADNLYALFVNNERVGAGVNWQELDQFAVTRALRPGKNVLAVMAENSDSGPGGLVVRLRFKPKQGPEVSRGSGSDWKVSPRDTPGWRELAFDDSEWANATTLGPLDQTAPWGQLKRSNRDRVSPEFVKKERPTGPFRLLAGDRVVWVGDALVERASQEEFWEATLAARTPELPILFRNLGWSGDTLGGDARAGFGTPADGYSQLKIQVFQTRPTVVFVCYGAVHSFEGVAGLGTFEQGLNKLLDDLSVTQAQLVLVSPIRHEHLPPPFPNPQSHNGDLELYAAKIGEIAQSRRLPYLDLFGAVVGTAPVTRESALTENGVHLNRSGYVRLAEVFSRQIGLNPAAVEVEIDSRSNLAKSTGATCSKPVWNDAGHLTWTLQRQQWPTTPPEMGSELRLKVIRLPAGVWELTGRGDWEKSPSQQAIARGTSEEWARGLDIFAGPGSRGFDRLRQGIIKKNQLYFHRWRPQNDTYLFGFRKHEQGQNAKEIPQFDPLVEGVEREIQALQRPAQETWSLRKVE